VDEIVRQDADIEQALDIVYKELLVDTLGIEAGVVPKMPHNWRKLNDDARLGRS
jgi:hypothetical protein